MGGYTVPSTVDKKLLLDIQAPSNCVIKEHVGLL